MAFPGSFNAQQSAYYQPPNPGLPFTGGQINGHNGIPNGVPQNDFVPSFTANPPGSSGQPPMGNPEKMQQSFKQMNIGGGGNFPPSFAPSVSSSGPPFLNQTESKAPVYGAPHTQQQPTAWAPTGYPDNSQAPPDVPRPPQTNQFAPQQQQFPTSTASNVPSPMGFHPPTPRPPGAFAPQQQIPSAARPQMPPGPNESQFGGPPMTNQPRYQNAPSGPMAQQRPGGPPLPNAPQFRGPMAQPMAPPLFQSARPAGPPGMPQMPGQMAPPGMGMPPSGPGQMPMGQQQGMGPPGQMSMGPGGMPGGMGMGMAPSGPGQMPMAPGMGMAPMGSQQKRLDPNAMPSAIQFMEDDRVGRSGNFATGYPRADQPPLVTTNIICEDQGNCNPAFMRSTLYTYPNTADMQKQSAIPMGLCISPLARLKEEERPLPIINLGDLGPVRCHRCKAYMSPFMEFNDGGRRFRCPFCRSNTDVPTEYFAHLDHMGKRVDVFERPELCLGSYEFVATKEYCKNGMFPNPPAFIFMLDVSYNAIRCGLVPLFCSRIKQLLRNLPKEQNMDTSAVQVGFATYDQNIHFYNLKSHTGQPKMMIVSDVQEVFVPLIDGFFVNPQEAETALDSLLDQIPKMFADNKTTETVLGPVIQAGMEALKASDRAGKLFVFHTSLPTYDAPGRLKNRDDRKLLGTEKEKQVLAPASEFYGTLAKECVAAGCCIDCFLFPNSYIDVSTIGCLCATTGGQVFKYQYFQADLDGTRFIDDLTRDVERPIVFDVVMRVRTSTGIRATDFFGNIYMSNTTDVEIAALDCDKAISVEIKYDDKLEEQEGAYIQTAALFTSVSGQRRLRIHNMSIAVSSEMANLYRSADMDGIINYLAKQAERSLLHKSPKEIRESLVTQCAKMLATYRAKVAQPSAPGQLILPEGMKLAPLYVNCIMKHSAFSGGSELNIDDRSYLMQVIASMRVVDTLAYFYPRVLPLVDQDEKVDCGELPTAVRGYYENLHNSGAYLVENGFTMFIWMGSNLNPQWIQDVFGANSLAQINPETHEVPDKDNDNSRRLRMVLKKVRSERPRCMKLYVVHAHHKLEPWFKQFLVEDKGPDMNLSYVDFLCHIHKEIRSLLD